MDCRDSNSDSNKKLLSIKLIQALLILFPIFAAFNLKAQLKSDIGIMGGILPKWNKDKCIDCNLCVNICPAKAIYKEDGEYKFDQEKCIYCSVCTSTCPTDAWEIEKQGSTVWIGGTLGKFPRLATQLTDIIEDENEVLEVVEKSVKYYQENGRKKERFGHMIDKVGVEKVKKDILG